MKNIPLWRCAPSPFSGIAARCGRGTPPARRGGPCAGAAGLDRASVMHRVEAL